MVPGPFRARPAFQPAGHHFGHPGQHGRLPVGHPLEGGEGHRQPARQNSPRGSGAVTLTPTRWSQRRQPPMRSGAAAGPGRHAAVKVVVDSCRLLGACPLCRRSETAGVEATGGVQLGEPLWAAVGDGHASGNGRGGRVGRAGPGVHRPPPTPSRRPQSRSNHHQPHRTTDPLKSRSRCAAAKSTGGRAAAHEYRGHRTHPPRTTRVPTNVTLR